MNKLLAILGIPLLFGNEELKESSPAQSIFFPACFGIERPYRHESLNTIDNVLISRKRVNSNFYPSRECSERHYLLERLERIGHKSKRKKSPGFF